MDEQERLNQLAAHVVENMQGSVQVMDGLVDLIAKIDPSSEDDAYWRGWSEGFKTAIDAFAAGIRNATGNHNA